ncbi:ribose 5-phosphate isomerase A [Salinicoccus roseus]|uniref:Ribose 5-phosphate isomerase A n=1 Tax=Salinicoccus roseus TaxID=45670 RepID=A0A0C2HGN0_9STAP|nr:ribose 5-phosphate isomerase A [Salinicoccus roseus]KIH70769.1 hypothetical protein SN16_06325 [Salinicoccus roseus]MDB0580407.1 ribose 5-phosphate isomerase A [Salinicoccus roseus]OZT76835.1 ribose 5-phosphate isomerase A [Salinicoccus roseus]
MNEVYDALNTFLVDESVVGMGSGSTIEGYIPYMKEHVDRYSLDVAFIPTSKKTEDQLKRHGLAVVHHADRMPVTIDGADQFNEARMVIKGGGGSLLREKQVGYFSDQIVIIAHQDKKVEDFSGIAIPVEINTYLYEMTVGTIEENFGAETEMRTREDGLFITDNGNYIVDCHFSDPQDMDQLHNDLVAIPGVVETGIFNRKIRHIFSFDDQGAYQEYAKDR